MSYGWTRWTLFIAMAMFVPLYFYLFVIAGFLPYAAVLGWTLFDFNVVYGAHAILYGLVLYGVASGIAFLVCKLPRTARLPVTVVLVLLSAWAGTVPIFGIDHGSKPHCRAYEMLMNEHRCW